LNNTKSAFADSPAIDRRGIQLRRTHAGRPAPRDSPHAATMAEAQSAKADFVLL